LRLRERLRLRLRLRERLRLRLRLREEGKLAGYYDTGAFVQQIESAFIIIIITIRVQPVQNNH
jgi:hypothetical protein